MTKVYLRYYGVRGSYLEFQKQLWYVGKRIWDTFTTIYIVYNDTLKLQNSCSSRSVLHFAVKDVVSDATSSRMVFSVDIIRRHNQAVNPVLWSQFIY